METAYRIQQRQNKVGNTARNIKARTSKQPSNLFLWLSAGAMSALMFNLARQKRRNSFIGKWVAPLVLYGILNKLKKRLRRELTERVKY